MSEKLTQDCLDSYLCDAFAELRPSLTVHHGECIVEMEQAYNQIKEQLQQKQTVITDHIIAKLIDTLEWKFSHFPGAKEDFVTVRISRRELQEIKDFVEVVEK